VFHGPPLWKIPGRRFFYCKQSANAYNLQHDMQKLSLTCIAGNCEQDVERFLDAFQPHVDEVVMVRAIGSLQPDKTLEIAKKRGCKTAVYLNGTSSESRNWPHVDHFGEAREMARKMATGDWCMWADLDDTAEGMENARKILAGIPKSIGLIQCPYIVGNQGVISNLRERFWRNNGNFKWVNALHENLVPIKGTDGPIGKTEQVRIIHAPRHDRDCSKERNMRILESIPEQDRTIAHSFYLTMEYTRRHDPRAVEAAKQFLANPESATPERYELFMTLASMTEDLASRASIYTQAVAEDPGRAEALYELAALSLACDETDRAMNYARLMMACQWPDEPYWNHRKMFYGFFRDDLFLQCLRATGRIEESDARRMNIALRTKQPIISLLHASRGRPEQASRCRSEWLMAADSPERVEHLFIVDLDDEDAELLFRFNTFGNPGVGPVAAWNEAARRSCGEVLVQLSDDWKPTKGWDTAILNAIGDTSKPAVLAISDGHRTDDLLCMAILTRARYQAQGHLFHPEFFSMFSDNWFSECAFRDGVVIDARDRITFEHMHPAFGKGKMDETYARSNHSKNYKTGQSIMRRLSAGIITSHDVLGWCDYRDFYAYVAETLPEGGTFVEIGSWQGQSIIHLCQRLQDLSKTARVFVVDTFKGEKDQPMHTGVVEAAGGSIRHIFEANIKAAGVDHMITIIEGDSAESAAKFADFECDGIYIDAAHDYVSVVNDLAAWWPKLAPQGIWSGHDYPWHEVKQAVDEHAAANDYKITEVCRVWVKTN
jgi:hypothetical protein